jgi:hypothetical protein
VCIHLIVLVTIAVLGCIATRNDCQSAAGAAFVGMPGLGSGA